MLCPRLAAQGRDPAPAEPPTAHQAPLLLAGPAPHAEALTALQGVFQALDANRAAPAHLLGLGQLPECGTAGRDREEQLGVTVPASPPRGPAILLRVTHHRRLHLHL